LTPAPTSTAPPVPFYKKPLFWVTVAGGIAVAGGGGYLIFRRKV
jgi:LPXTG-motif cell wall-anchored protein